LVNITLTGIWCHGPRTEPWGTPLRLSTSIHSAAHLFNMTREYIGGVRRLYIREYIGGV